jgi:signal transduction histidine kinase
MQSNKVFNRTRIHLVTCYGIALGSIISLSGYAVHCIMTHAFDTSLRQHLETETQVDNIHHALEAVLVTPGVVDSGVEKILPGICFQGQPCPPPTAQNNNQLQQLAKQQNYSLNLLNKQGVLLASFGNTQALHDHMAMMIAQQVDPKIHSRKLRISTKQGEDWGYLQVSHPFHFSYKYHNAFCLIMFFGVPLLILSIAATSWWLAWIALRPVRQSYEKMEQFTADAAHELRTPLAVARTAIESSIASSNLNPDISNDLQIVQRQITNLSRLSQELLWLSRSNSGECNAQLESCCMKDLVSDLGDELFTLAMEKSIDLQIRVPDHPIYVFGCSDQLYRAIANLIGNGIQYTEAGGIVRVTLSTREHQAIVTVEDNGIGMLPQDLFRIFDRFYRVRSARSSIHGENQSRYASGTGLGLPIAQAVVQSHRGTVHVKSQLGKGSLFTVQLPLKR